MNNTKLVFENQKVEQFSYIRQDQLIKKKKHLDCTIACYHSISELKKEFQTEKIIFDTITGCEKSGELTEKKGCFFYCYVSSTVSSRTIFIYCPNMDVLSLKDAIATAVTKISQYSLKSIYIPIPSWMKESENSAIEAIVEGVLLGGYQFHTFKSDLSLSKKNSRSILIGTFSNKVLNEKISEAVYTAGAQILARNLKNAPSNECTPCDIVNFIKREFNGNQIKITIDDEKKLIKKGMNCFHAVGKGSANKPYLVKISLNEHVKKQPIVFVGKGITFDTGGISLKPSKSMSEMKADMGGAAAVIGAMKGLMDINYSYPIVGYVALAENMPSSTAYKPGDVLVAANKKTVEITNTDAEGRLVLADTLCEAGSLDPLVIVDVATLTGACCVALGNQYAAVLGNNQTYIDELVAIGKRTGEKVWPLPLDIEYFEYLKSDTADFVNASEAREAGTITAAKFLEQFVEKQNWCHLDIASVMSHSADSGIQKKGMSGFGARLLMAFAQKLAS